MSRLFLSREPPDGWSWGPGFVPALIRPDSASGSCKDRTPASPKARLKPPVRD